MTMRATLSSSLFSYKTTFRFVSYMLSVKILYNLTVLLYTYRNWELKTYFNKMCYPESSHIHFKMVSITKQKPLQQLALRYKFNQPVTILFQKWCQVCYCVSTKRWKTFTEKNARFLIQYNALTLTQVILTTCSCINIILELFSIKCHMCI